MEVRIFLLGSLTIEQQGQLIDWPAARPSRSVLRRLLTAPGRRLLRLALIDNLWPDLDLELADRYLSNAASQIRGLLGKEALRLADGVYALDTQIWLDLDAASSLLRQAEDVGASTPAAISLLEETAALLSRGQACEGEEGQWRYGVQRHAEDMLKQARIWLAAGYEGLGKRWQATEQYRLLCEGLPCNEEALRLWMTKLDRTEATMHYQRIKKQANDAGLPLSEETTQEIETTLSRRSMLQAGASLFAIGAGLPQLFADEALALYGAGIIACWQLYFSGQRSQVAAILPLYRSQISRLADGGGPLQQRAALLASQAWQLSKVLSEHTEDYGEALVAGQHALRYASLSGDPSMIVSATIRIGTTYKHRRQHALVLTSYEQALPLLSHATPLLQSVAWTNIANATAQSGRPEDARVALANAYATFPDNPEDDAARGYIHASHYSLYLYGDCATQILLNDPAAAQIALDQVMRGDVLTVDELDLRYYQAQIATAQGELDAASGYLLDGVALARRQGSRLYLGKLADVHATIRQRWPGEARLPAIVDAFAG